MHINRLKSSLFENSAAPPPTDSGVDYRVWTDQVDRGFRLLRFQPEIEQHFRRFHLQSVRNRILLCVVSMMSFTFWLAASNRAAEPVEVEAVNTLKHQLAVYVQRPISVLLLITLFIKPLYFRFWLLVAPVVLATSGAFGGFSVAETVVQGNVHAFVGMLSGFLALYILVGMLFWQIAAVGTIINAGYAMSLIHYGAPPELMRFETTVLVAVTLVALIFAYSLEHSQRMAYLQSKIMQVLSSVDALTGLKNRRVFDEELESLWKQAHRDGNALGLLMIDVDHFKAYNDHYGHQAGDRCLSNIGKVLSEAVRRPLDVAARIGGEEFALLFYAPTSEHVVAAGREIEAAVRDLKIPHARSDSGAFVTVSLGAGQVYPRPDRSPESLVRQVDQALYQAKSQGRGRLVWFESTYKLGDDTVAAIRTG